MTSSFHPALSRLTQVRSLRGRIEHGAYAVDNVAVAEALLRRVDPRLDPLAPFTRRGGSPGGAQARPGA